MKRDSQSPSVAGKGKFHRLLSFGVWSGGFMGGQGGSFCSGGLLHDEETRYLLSQKAAYVDWVKVYRRSKPLVFSYLLFLRGKKSWAVLMISVCTAGHCQQMAEV